MVSWVKKVRQRRSVRRAVGTKCQVVAEQGFRLLGDRTFDVSEHGLLLASEADVWVGERVFVALETPQGVSWIDGEARIVRVVRGRRGGDRGPAIGLRFSRMDTLDQVILSASLRGLPPPLPARHLRRDYAGAVQVIAERPQRTSRLGRS